MTTTHQVNTLLQHLDNHTLPPEGMQFFNPVVKAHLDYLPPSIERLETLLTQLAGNLAKNHMSLASLISPSATEHTTRPDIRNFFLTIAAYLANYLARRTDEPITWYNYFEAMTEIGKKNREHGTNFQLDNAFENSLIAKIGEDMYCQPLKAIQAQIQGEGKLSDFIQAMTTGIFTQNQVNILNEPHQVCRDYLRKVRTGRLLDTTMGFYDIVQSVHFDYSETSLHQIDEALTALVKQQHLTPEGYLPFIRDPANQATLYLLSFYLGTTSARLSNIPIQWANYSYIRQRMHRHNPNHHWVDSIENSFVMRVENQFLTPLLVFTNRLFAIAEKAKGNPYPTTLVQFAQDFCQNFAHKPMRLSLKQTDTPTSDLATLDEESLEKEENLKKESLKEIDIAQTQVPTIRYFHYQETAIIDTTSSQHLPKIWEMAMWSAGYLLANDLLQIFDGGQLEPRVLEFDFSTNTSKIQRLTDIVQNTEISQILTPQGKNKKPISQDFAQHMAMFTAYLQHNPKQLPFMVATYDSQVALPSGNSDGVVIDIAIYHEPQLRLQFILPYRGAADTAGFAIYPLVYLQKTNAMLPATAAEKLGDTGQSAQQKKIFARLPALVTALYQGAMTVKSPMHEGNFWQNYYIEPPNNNLMNWEKSPLQHAQDCQQAQKIDLTLLPVSTLATTGNSPNAQSALPNEQSIKNLAQPVQNIIEKPVIEKPVIVPTQMVAQPNPSENSFLNNHNSFLNPSTHIPPKVAPNQGSDIAATSQVPPSETAAISPQLLAKLRQDQQRLQSELSTSDGDKERKIFMIVGVMAVLIVLLSLVVWLRK